MKGFLHTLAGENKRLLKHKSSIVIISIFLIVYLAIALIFTAADDELADGILSLMSGYQVETPNDYTHYYEGKINYSSLSSAKDDAEIARQYVGNLDEDDSLVERYEAKTRYNSARRNLSITEYRYENEMTYENINKTAAFSIASLSVFSIIAAVGTIIAAAVSISSNDAESSYTSIKKIKLLTCKFISVLLYGLFMYVLGIILTILFGGLLFGFSEFSYVFVSGFGPDAVLAASVIPYTIASAALSFTQVVLFISIVFLTYCLFKSSVLAVGAPILTFVLSTLLSLPIAALDIDITKYLIFFNLDLKFNLPKFLDFSRLTAYQISKPYVFSLVFALMSRNKGNFLCFAHNLIQEPCRSPFCFPCGVGVDVHCGTDIRVSEKFLHIFGFCTA